MQEIQLLLTGSFIGVIIGGLVTRRLVDRHVRTMRRITRDSAWRDCIRFHRFDA
jgi:Na+/glutamate symporter